MARGLGELVVRLGLDAADFTSGLTKAERDAQKFARTLQNDVAVAASALSGVLAAISVGALVKTFESAVEGVARFKQLSEEVGDTAVAFAGLQSSAVTSGVAINDIASASVRLTSALSKADEEGSQAGKAIKALGLNFAEFKAQSPVTQLETLATAFAKFEDGAGKTAVAVALLGRQGAQLIPFFNDLAEAGGRNLRLTQEQIEAADKFTKELARLKGEIALVVQGIAVDLIPAISGIIKEMTEGIRVAGGFVNALRLFGTLDLGSDLPKKIKELGAEIENLEKQKTTGGLFSGWNNKHLDFLIGDAKKKIEFLILQIKPSFRDVVPDVKPVLNPDLGKTKTGTAFKERTSDAQRYLETLEKQLQGTLELNAEETALIKIYELKKDALSGLNAATEAAILDNARQIDVAKELKKAEEEANRQAEEAARRRERIAKETARRVEGIQREAQSIRDNNDRIQEQIAFLRGGEEGLRAYTDAKLAKAIAENIDKEATARSIGATKEETDAIRDVTNALKETQAALGQLDIAKKFAAEAKNLQDVKNALSDALVDPLSDFILQTKSAKDAFKSFTDDLTRQLTRLASQNIANMLFGGKNSSGPDFFAVISKFIGLFGGTGGGVDINLAGGGPPALAGGTSNWRGGQAIVGEAGPELINLRPGAQVIPMDKFRKQGSVTNIFHVNVMPGANSASVMQTKAMLRDAVMQSARER